MPANHMRTIECLKKKFMKNNTLFPFKHAIVGFALSSFSSLAQSPLDIRVALVIGNAGYKNVPALSNSGNDAKSMTIALKHLGFKVFEVVDGDKHSMGRALEQMQAQLKGQQAVAMLYYAGHGLQLDWRNYMVPIDARLDSAEDVPKQTMDVDQVIQAFKNAGTRMNILVLDACRDNPFSSSNGSKGLAQVDAPPGTYLAYATAPGNVAEDGDEASGNGLFTQFLLKELQRPATIESVFKRVRLQVRQKSQGRQVPWDSSSLEEEFYFNDGKKFTFTVEDIKREYQAIKNREEELKRAAELALAREKIIETQRAQELAIIAEAQKLKEEQGRRKAEAEAKLREQLLIQTAEQERIKIAQAQQALERVRQQEAQRIKEFEMAKLKVEEEERINRQTPDRQFETQKADWDKIKESRNVDDFYAFLNKYPTGYITEQATFAIEALQRAQITPQPNKEGIIQTLGVSRYKLGDYVEYRTLDERGIQTSTDKITITRIENGMVYVNNEQEPSRTIDGGLIRVRSQWGIISYDPPRLEIPGGEFLTGKKWTWRSWMQLPDGKRLQLQSDVKIIGIEEITVPAGTFKTFRVSQVQRLSNGIIYNKLDCWYEPDWGMSIKCLRDFPGDAVGKPLKQTLEMTTRKRGAT